MNKFNNLKGTLILGTATVIWGLAFVAQSGAADLIPSFAFNAMRSFIAAAFLFLLRPLLNRKAKIPFIPKDKKDKRTFFSATLICGVLIAVSVNFQQFGLAFYPDGAAAEARAGFLTALYVILVPIFSVFLRKKIRPVVWVGVVIAMAGIYLLCLSGGLDAVYLGDVLVFCCAVSFALHILAVDRFVEKIDGVRLCCMQFLVCGIISAVLSLIFETVSVENIISAAPQILYLGIMSSGIAYTLQIIGQKYAEATVASITMSFESVVAALGGWFISGNTLAGRELLGCVLVFAAIIISQLPERKKTAEAV